MWLADAAFIIHIRAGTWYSTWPSSLHFALLHLHEPKHVLDPKTSETAAPVIATAPYRHLGTGSEVLLGTPERRVPSPPAVSTCSRGYIWDTHQACYSQFVSNYKHLRQYTIHAVATSYWDAVELTGEGQVSYTFMLMSRFVSGALILQWGGNIYSVMSNRPGVVCCVCQGENNGGVQKSAPERGGGASSPIVGPVKVNVCLSGWISIC